MHLDRCGGATGKRGSHFEVGAVVHIHDHCDKIGREAEAVQGAFNTWPWEVVICLSDVIENCIACFGGGAWGSGAGFTETRRDRIDGFVYVFSFQESELGRVKERVRCDFGA